ncbi:MULTISPECIES: Gfo/Idh/MocA family protein [Chelativorans]|jgi:predicted dehydrogenase|uniref:Oxidoreductase-like protein n=1 Tax=Chelativorans sp. (strain BNC1) TaxID=266779 RepID=Q11AR3_CHESB|nr:MULTISPECIES: Gfo/Idh/MocA family oxidoreductase [Chelativorans]
MTSKTAPVRFGIIGLGFGAGRIPMIESCAETELVAVSARSEEKAREVGEKHGVDWHTDYNDLLARDDIDVVGLYTPSGAHLDIALAAAKAGKHMVATKPLEINLKRVDEIIAAYDAAGLKLATEYVVRYLPGNYALHQAVTSGKLGKMILGEFSEKLYRPQWYYELDGGWRSKWEVSGGGTVVNQTIHTLDQMQWMFGKVESVTAFMGTYMANIESEDTATAMVKFTSGAIGIVVGTTTFRNEKPPTRYGGGTMRRIEVNGDLGSARIEDETITMMAIEGDPELPREVQPPAANVFEDMARWVRDDAYDSPTLVKPAESRASMELVLAIYESARSGKTVVLNS